MRTSRKVTVVVFTLVILIVLSRVSIAIHRRARVQQTKAKLEQFIKLTSELGFECEGWKASVVPLDRTDLVHANLLAHRCLTCLNESSGETVKLYLVFGSARHVTIHSLDFSYRYSGYRSEEQISSRDVVVGDMAHQFATSSLLHGDSADGEKHLRVFWAFSEDGTWKAPMPAKRFFAGRPSLFKIYLIAESPSFVGAEDSVASAFVNECLPHLTSLLFKLDSKR